MTTTDDPLVSTDWLAAHLGDPKVRMIDASFKMPGMMPLPKDDYLASHIPGAVFFDVDAVSDHSNPLPHMFPDAAQFGRDAGALGVSNDDTVVLYDSGGWVAAPRVVDVPVVRPSQRSHPQRRSEEVGRGRTQGREREVTPNPARSRPVSMRGAPAACSR